MAIKITLKNSVVQDSVPTTSHLAAVGELALNANINSLGIYMRASDNSIVKMAGPGSVTTPAASTTVAGIAELATSGETTTGTDAARVVTPAGLKAVTDAERATSNSSYMVASGGTMTGALTMPNGSNSAPSVNFGDTDSGVFGGTNTVSLTAGGTTKLTAATDVSVFTSLLVDGDGLRLKLGDAQDFQLYHTGTTNKIESFVGDIELLAPTSKAITFGINQSESARIDSSGRLLVGSSSAIPVGSTASALSQFHGTANALVSSFVGYANNSGGAVVSLGKSRGAIATPGTTVQDNDNLGTIRFAGDDGTDIQTQAALFECNVDGTVASNQIPAEFVLKTAASDGTMTTRLTITSAGLVNVPDNGKFTAGSSNDLEIYHDGTNNVFDHIAGSSTRFMHGNEKMLVMTPDSHVELYFDNSKKLNTNANGVHITDTLTFANTGDSITLADDQKLSCGNGGDLKIWHDGSHNKIAGSNGNTHIETGGTVEINKGTSENMAKFISDGAVELYHNNVKRFETASWGTQIHGALATTSHVDIASDSGILKLGASADLQIFHDGTSNIILANSGDLNIRTNNSENSIVARQNGAAELYHDNSKKLETMNGGVSVTGQVAVAGSGVSLSIADSGKAAFGNGDDLQIYHSGAHSFISNTTGTLQLENAGNITITKGGTENMARFVADGAAELYYDNSLKAYTTSGGFKVDNKLEIPDGGATGTSARIVVGTGDDLKIYHDGSNSYISETGTGDLYIRGSSNVRITDTDSNKMILCQDGGETQLYYDGAEKLNTESTGIGVTGNVDATGNLYGASLLLSSNAFIGDNNKLNLGTGNDLKIYHDGNNFITTSSGYLNIDVGNENLYLDANEVRLRGEDGGEILARFIDDGAVELNYDNVKKFETTSAGGTLTGALTVTNEINLFNGTTNASRYIDAGLGDTNTLFLRGCSGGDANHETLAQFKRGGSSQLFFDASKKLETTSSGVKVTTDLVTTGNCSPSADGGGNLGSADYSWYNVFVNNDIFIADSGRVNFGENNDLYLYHNGTSSFIDNGTGHLYIRGNSDGDVGGNIYIQALEGEHGISLIHDGAVYLFYNNSEKLQTRSDGVRVDDNLLVNTDSDDANINASSGESQFSLRGNGQGLRLSTSGPSYWNAFASADYHIRFRRQGSNTGNIYGESNGTTTFNTGSDYRLKQNVTAYTDGITKLKKLKPCEFEFKLEPGKVVDGFIAHEVTDAGFPWIVKGTKDAVESDGKIDPQSMDYSKLTPILTAALQEAIAKIEALETKVAALEGA